METIPLINNDFKDVLIRDFVQQFHEFIPDGLDAAAVNRLRVRLEVRLRRAYRRSFAHGEEFVRVTMDEEFEEYVEELDGMFDGGRGDGGPHDRGHPAPLARLRGGAMTTRTMTYNNLLLIKSNACLF